ncbi:MAG: hydroxymethylglutaryl-CoA lyase [Myxococcales bacterium]|nr:hydroxymethylglutaryl-CoA lyase [Myxococcales bacterium]
MTGLPTTVPEWVHLVEVGPRDGLQNERVRVATATKVHFVEALVAAGLRRIEVSSFVHPRAVPQLADAEAVFAALRPADGVRFSALVPNQRGLERALAAGVRDIAVFTAASDTFVQHNIRMTLAESLRHFAPVVQRALDAGLAVRGYVSAVFGCPYEGSVSPEQGIVVARSLLDMGCGEISIGDTIGVATPGDVARWLGAAHAAGLPFDRLALHFHDTRGTALANVMAGLQHGIRTFDASAGGLGGCPFAPGASGNLATEDLVYALHGLGFATGVDLAGLVAASGVLAGELDHLLPGRYFQAARVQGCLPANGPPSTG